jgi:hypothetical protein
MEREAEMKKVRNIAMRKISAALDGASLMAKILMPFWVKDTYALFRGNLHGPGQTRKASRLFSWPINQDP